MILALEDFSVQTALESCKKVSRVGTVLCELEKKGKAVVLGPKLFDALAEYNLGSKETDRISVSEFLTSDDASVLLPRIVQGTLREAAEPLLIMKQFFSVVRLTAGNSIEFPSISAMTAADIAEGQPYPKAIVDFALHKSMEIRVGKYGLAFGATDEAISDSLWDVIGILTRGAGRAMARWEEQKRSNAFHTYAHVRFDGGAAETSESHPTGLGWDPTATPGGAPSQATMSLNDTLSTMDWIDLVATLMAHEFTPTDVLMHPLYWPSYAKTIFYGGLGNIPARWNPKSVPTGPEAIGQALPFAIRPVLSPRILFNRPKKTGDLYIVDRNEVGVELVKEDITSDEWREPEADIRNIKVKARKGWGILNKGRAIICARNIRADVSYDPTVSFVHNV